MKRHTWSRNLGPKSEKRGSRELSFVGVNMWRLWWKDTRLCFAEIAPTAAFLAKMAKRTIPRHDGGTKARVYPNERDSESGYHNRRLIRPQRHLCQLVKLSEPTYPKSMVCHPDMLIYKLIFPAPNSSILMNMPRIASAINILIQICWLMTEHPLVSTLSAAW